MSSIKFNPKQPLTAEPKWLIQQWSEDGSAPQSVQPGAKKTGSNLRIGVLWKPGAHHPHIPWGGLAEWWLCNHSVVFCSSIRNPGKPELEKAITGDCHGQQWHLDLLLLSFPEVQGRSPHLGPGRLQCRIKINIAYKHPLMHHSSCS